MPLFDFHAHFSFKPANSRNFLTDMMPDADHWNERFKRKADHSALAGVDNDVVKSSQLHGNSATAGGFRVICNGLYPLEQGFTSALLNKPLATLTGFSPEVLQDIYARKQSYFQHMEREYTNLIVNQNKTRFSTAGNSYRVVDSYAEIERTLANAPDTLCIVNSIEGAHAFGDNFFDRLGKPVSIAREEGKFLRRVGQRDGDSWFELYIEGMIANIDKMTTTWEHTPLFVTMAHHYYNHLCGHSPSLTNMVHLFLPQSGGAPNAQGFDTNYFFLGIRPWGKRIIAHLLRRRNSRGEPVRRVLIDAKHMSPQARLDYYEIVDMRMAAQDPIPIVVSHTAVSGRRDMRATIANDNNLLPGEKDRSRFFYNGIINLFDDEIVRVVKSDGLMGLMIDERRIMGDSIPPEAGITKANFDTRAKANRREMRDWTTAKQQHAWGDIDDAALAQKLDTVHRARAPLLNDLRPAYLSVVFRQIFHILDLVGTPAEPAKGWNHLSLGTDYDGVINPIDIYPQSADMKDLKRDLVNFWNATCQHPDPAIAQLYTDHRFGKSTASLIEKLLWSNGMEFLRKYYHDGYLVNGVVG